MSAINTILLVEDNADDATLVTIAFHRAGFDHGFRTVSHPDAAIAYLEGKDQFADRSKFPFPHLILLDHQIIGDSREIIKWVRAQPELANLPIVVLSGSGDPHHRREAYDLGANAYEIKPDRFEDLIATANRIGTFWLRSFGPRPADQMNPQPPPA